MEQKTFDEEYRSIVREQWPDLEQHEEKIMQERNKGDFLFPDPIDIVANPFSARAYLIVMTEVLVDGMDRHPCEEELQATSKESSTKCLHRLVITPLFPPHL